MNPTGDRSPSPRRRRWRFYSTAAGRRPVRAFLDELEEADAVAVAAAMREIATDGLVAARHVRGEIYEVRADGDRQAYRLLFAPVGRQGQILLALEAFSKKTQKTPPRRSTSRRRGSPTGFRGATRIDMLLVTSQI